MSVNIIPYGEKSILIQWPKTIDERTIKKVHSLREKIHQELDPLIIESIPSYQELLVIYSDISLDLISKKVIELEESLKIENTNQEIWNIPIYINEHKDHDAIITHSNMGFDEYMEQFMAVEFTIAMKGFLPGFLYLSGLPQSLHIPRKTKPDKKITAGSVAIGGAQAGIYPQDSPGGWHVIGNTPIPLFDIQDDRFSAFWPGAKVKFYRIEKDEYQSMKSWDIDIIRKEFIKDE